VTAMGDYQSQAMGSPSSISQYAVMAAIKGCEEDILGVVKTLKVRSENGLKAFAEVPQLKVSPPDGAFYFWVDVRACLGKTFRGRAVKGSKDFCDILLEEFYVATVPGIECGSEGFMRLSFAVSEETMKRAIARMKDFIAELK